MSCCSSRAPTPEHESENLYALNFKKIEAGCADLWFGSTNLANGTEPRKIALDESEPFHFVQILYLIKESSWQDDKWMLFTKQWLLSIVKKDEQIYLGNKQMFGKSFVDQFPAQIMFFIDKYCDVVGEH